MLQLRWAIDGAVARPPVLQMRHCFALDASGALCPGIPWTEWVDVPTVYIPPGETKPDPSLNSLLNKNEP